MKIGIVGAGYIGSSAAYTLALRERYQHIVLVDVDRVKAKAQVLDLAGVCALNCTTQFSEGDFADLHDAEVVIFTAGVSQPGHSRGEVLQKDTRILRQTLPKVLESAPNAVVIIATQPVELMTNIALELADPNWIGRILGVGTVLETARLRAEVAKHLDVLPQDVQGYVIGEQGSSALVAWSSVWVRGEPLSRIPQWTRYLQAEVTDTVQRGVSYQREGKGQTQYGVGAAIASIVEAIADNSNALLTVTGFSHFGVAMALPRPVGTRGVGAALEPSLSAEEAKMLLANAEHLQSIQTRLIENRL